MISEKWMSLPRPIRSFIVDAVEGSIAAVVLLNIVLPHNLTEATGQAVIIAGAISSPIIAAARRDILPAVLSWWADVRRSTED